MKLREMILAKHSKAQRDKILNWIGTDQKRFDQLFDLFLNDEYRIIQRAAWPLSYAVINNPGFIKKHFKQLINNLERPNLPDAVKRNTLRLLQFVSIPAKYHGPLMTLCFGYIASPTENAAIKAFSLTILYNLTAIYPDIRTELKTTIEERWDTETAAFHSRGRKILTALG